MPSLHSHMHANVNHSHMQSLAESADFEEKLCAVVLLVAKRIIKLDELFDK